MGKTISFAEKKLKELNEQHNSGYTEEDYLMPYWAAYLDGAKAQLREDDSEKVIDRVATLTNELLQVVATYGKEMGKLIQEVNIELERLNTDED